MVLAQFAIPTQLLQLMCPLPDLDCHSLYFMFGVTCIYWTRMMFNNNSLSTGTTTSLNVYGIRRNHPVHDKPYQSHSNSTILSRIRSLFSLAVAAYHNILLGASLEAVLACECKLAIFVPRVHLQFFLLTDDQSNDARSPYINISCSFEQSSMKHRMLLIIIVCRTKWIICGKIGIDKSAVKKKSNLSSW